MQNLTSKDANPAQTSQLNNLWGPDRVAALRFSYSGPDNKVQTRLKDCTPNQTITFEDLLGIITSPPPKELETLRKQMSHGIRSGLSWDQIKKSTNYKVSSLKKELPWFLCSGVCPIHHVNKNLTYNGCIQIDIDFKFRGGDILAVEVLEAIKAIDYILFATISPSGFGVKAIVPTTNLEKKHHGEAQKQVIGALTKRLDFDGITFDALGASQPCYIPYNSNPYYNLESSVFEVQAKKPKQTGGAVTMDINEDFTPASPDAITAALEYVTGKGFKFEPGSRHLFLTHFAIGCNLFGISPGEYWRYINSEYDLPSNEKQSNFDSPFWKYKDNAGAWVYKLKAAQLKAVTVYVAGKKGDYVSDLVRWEDVEGTICVSPTASGKTYFLMSEKAKKIVFCPVLSLVNNIMESYKQYNPVAFTGQQKPTYDELKAANCIVTTYASFSRLREALDPFGDGSLKKYHGIVDEIHSATANGHQLKDLNKIVNSINEFRSFTGFTGTDLPSAHPALSELRRVILEIPRDPATYEILEVEHTLKAAKVVLEKAIYQKKKVIILQNRKNTSKSRETLKQYINRGDIWFFDSDSKEKPHYKEFVRTGIIPDHIKGIVTTTVIETGLSIVTPGDYVFCFLGSFHPVTIEQLRKRSRNAKSCHICIIKPLKRKKSKDGFSFLRFQNHIWDVCEKQCEILNGFTDLTQEEAAREAIAREAIQKLPIYLDGDTGRFEVNLLGVSNYTFNNQTTACNRNDKLMGGQLKKYQIFPVEKPTRGTDQKPTKAEKTRATEAGDILEAANQTEYEYQVGLLDGMPAAEIYCEEAIRLYSSRLEPVEKIVLQAFVDLSKYGNQLQVIGWLKANPKKAQRKRLLKRLRIKAILDESSHMEKNTAFVLVLRKLGVSFTPGETVTSEELKERVIDCLKLDKSLRLEPYIKAERNTKVIEVARLLFEVIKQTRKEAGEIIIEWLIEEICWAETYTVNPIEKETQPGVLAALGDLF